MILTLVLNGLMGIGMMVTVFFCLGTAESTLSETNTPFIEMFASIVGSTGGATAMVCGNMQTHCITD